MSLARFLPEAEAELVPRFCSTRMSVQVTVCASKPPSKRHSNERTGTHWVVLQPRRELAAFSSRAFRSASCTVLHWRNCSWLPSLPIAGVLDTGFLASVTADPAGLTLFRRAESWLRSLSIEATR